jgi:hypothetical protein
MNKKILVIGLISVFLISLTSFSFLIYKQFNKSDQENNIADDTIQINDDQEQNISNQSCTVDGVEYLDGESFPSSDSCNTCTCDNGIVSCTEKACTVTYTFEMSQFQSDVEKPEGVSIAYKYKLILALPNKAENDLSSDSAQLLIHGDKYSISFSGDLDYASPEFKNIHDHELIQTSPSTIYRIKDPDPYFTNYQKKYFEKFSNIYFYSPRYGVGTQECPFLSEGYKACGDYALFPKFTNTDETQLLYAQCAVNSETDAEKYCDEIVKSISVEKIL